ncbi:MAG: hypothetical protein ACREPM_19030, partial [Gemmatimonadaceae bacterium]
PNDPDATTDTTKPRPTYKTDGGRTVLGGGGITPDVILPKTPVLPADTSFPRALGQQIPKFRDALTDYALSLKASKAVTRADFVVTPAMRAELYTRMRARGVTVDSTTYAGASAVVDRLLGYEIARYVFGPDAEFARKLRDDAMMARALQLVAGARTPSELISRAAAGR